MNSNTTFIGGAKEAEGPGWATACHVLACAASSLWRNKGGSIKNTHLSYFRNLKFVFSVLICSSSVFCILALGSGQRLLYRLGSGLVLVLVLVLRFCAYSDGGEYS